MKYNLLAYVKNLKEFECSISKFNGEIKEIYPSLKNLRYELSNYRVLAIIETSAAGIEEIVNTKNITHYAIVTSNKKIRKAIPAINGFAMADNLTNNHNTSYYDYARSKVANLTTKLPSAIRSDENGKEHIQKYEESTHCCEECRCSKAEDPEDIYEDEAKEADNQNQLSKYAPSYDDISAQLIKHVNSKKLLITKTTLAILLTREILRSVEYVTDRKDLNAIFDCILKHLRGYNYHSLTQKSLNNILKKSASEITSVKITAERFDNDRIKEIAFNCELIL